MSVTGLATDGWLCDVNSTTIIVIADGALTGVLAPTLSIVGVLEVEAMAGAIEALDEIGGALEASLPLAATLEPEPLSIVGVLSCEGEIMTDLSLVRGDSRTIALSFFESDGVTDLDITGGVVKFAVAETPGDANADALIFKASYVPTDIAITSPAAAPQGTLFLRAHETMLEPGTYRFDVELTLQGTLVSSAGTFAFVAGSDVATATGVDFDALRVGQIVVPAGAFAGNQQPVTITAIDAGAGTVTFGGYPSFATEAGVTFNAYRGERSTPAGMSGTITICGDVVQ